MLKDKGSRWSTPQGVLPDRCGTQELQKAQNAVATLSGGYEQHIGTKLFEGVIPCKNLKYMHKES